MRVREFFEQIYSTVARKVQRNIQFGTVISNSLKIGGSSCRGGRLLERFISRDKISLLKGWDGSNDCGDCATTSNWNVIVRGIFFWKMVAAPILIGAWSILVAELVHRICELVAP